MKVNFQTYHYWRSECAMKEEKMGMFDKVKESLTKKEYTCDQCGATVLRAPLLADHQKEVLCPACT